MRFGLLFLSILCLVVSGYLARLIISSDIQSSGIYIILSCFLSLSAICFGWWISMHISKRQSTLAIIAQSRLNEFYLSQIEIVEECFPTGEKLTVEKAKAPENKKSLVSLIVILNFLEFISIGIKEKDLSESVCKAFFKNIFSIQWYRSSEYIHHQQVHESAGLFEHFEHYAKKWNKTLSKQIKQDK